MILYLNENYKFYKLLIKNNDFVTSNFKLLNGKIYKSSIDSNEIILALILNDDIDNFLKDLKKDLIDVFPFKLV